MKRYQGHRAPGGCRVTVDGRPLDPRTDLRRHADRGFEWGYDGSGPRQLALALLADCLGDDRLALAHHLALAEGLVAELAGERWTLTDREIRAALEATVTVPLDLAGLIARVRRH